MVGAARLRGAAGHSQQACGDSLSDRRLADAKNRLYRPIALLAAVALLVAIAVLGFSGAHEPEDAAFPGAPGPFLFDGNLNTHLWPTRVAAAYYFAYIFAIAPALGWRRKPDAAAVYT